MLDFANHYERENRKQDEMEQQRRQWAKEKPHSVLFKQLERQYQRGEMLPTCPTCGGTFDFKDIRLYTNARFFRAMQAKSAQTGRGEVQS